MLTPRERHHPGGYILDLLCQGGIQCEHLSLRCSCDADPCFISTSLSAPLCAVTLSPRWAGWEKRRLTPSPCVMPWTRVQRPDTHEETEVCVLSRAQARRTERKRYSVFYHMWLSPRKRKSGQKKMTWQNNGQNVSKSIPRHPRNSISHKQNNDKKNTARHIIKKNKTLRATYKETILQAAREKGNIIPEQRREWRARGNWLCVRVVSMWK